MKLLLAATVILVGMSILSSSPAAARVTDEEIQAAIDRGVQSLLALQNDKGWWSPGAVKEMMSLMHRNFPGGEEICAMTALAYADVSLSDPKMLKGFNSLLELKITQTYTVSLRIIAVSKLLHKLDRERHERAMAVIKADATLLVRGQHASGGWTYELASKPTIWDFSNTQMAVLALGEAINAGIEIPAETMKRVQDLYLKQQQADGGWTYGWEQPGEPFYNNSSGSMTAAGIASLFITRDYLSRGLGCPCKGDHSSSRTEQIDKAIEGGQAWLGKHFVTDRNPSEVMADGPWVTYWLYSCERVGLASGFKYFGRHDWYAEGADYFLKGGASGSWGAISDTAYTICFLVKGRAPILFNKLQFKGQWNNHPRDIAHLAAYVSKQKEQPIQWQVITLEAPVEEWHDAPILYLSAESGLKLTAEEKKKLRDFTDSGGSILFEASCGNHEAANSWRLLAKEIWPEWEMRLLDKEHPLFVADQKMTGGKLPTLFGMDDGLRTFAFISFADISCAWNTLAVAQQLPLFNLGSNLYAYTTDRGKLRAKLAARETGVGKKYAGQALVPGPKGTVTVARVKHGGDWYVGQNYHPWPLLASQFQAPSGMPAPESGVALTIKEAAPLAPGEAIAAGTNILYLDGRTGCELGANGGKWLKDFVVAGGFLFAEAVLGDKRFDEPARAALAAAGLAVKPLPVDSPLLTGLLENGARGYNVTKVGYSFTLRTERVGQPAPLLAGLYLGDKLVGIYSPFDIMFSQTGCAAFGNRGYSAEDARAIATNIVLLVSTR